MAVGIAALALLAMAGAGPSIAQDAAADAGVDAQEAVAVADPFEQAMAARTVAEYARRARDPMAMLTAARMLQDVPFADADEPAVADPAGSFTPAGLFAEARAFAEGNETLLQQINIAANMGQRGVIQSVFGSGLVRRVLQVNPRAAYRFTVDAKGGERLRLGAIGAPGTNLMIRMQDQNGKVVCMDDNGDYAPVCQLTPKSNAKYRVDIQNKSTTSSKTVVLSN